MPKSSTDATSLPVAANTNRGGEPTFLDIVERFTASSVIPAATSPVRVKSTKTKGNDTRLLAKSVL